MRSKVGLVGILNVTPDSFSDGGRFLDPQAAIRQARQLFKDGADLLDVGAESTNPWSKPLTPAEEWTRLQTVLPTLVKEFPGKISVDTYHPETATMALACGVTILNDVTTFRNPKLIKAAAQYRVICIVSHLPFDAPNIEVAHNHAKLDSIEQVVRDLRQRRQEMIDAGIPAKHIILDPGIGFGKTMRLNHELLNFAKYVPGSPVMIGYSRKRFLGEHRMELEPNLEAARTAIAAGAKYLRVHDVKGHHKYLTP